MMRHLKMIGDRFGKLTVVAEVEARRPPNGAPQRRFRCRCDCGTEILATGGHLRSGHTLSCGCIRMEGARKQGHQNRLHGEAAAQTPEYLVWKSMFTRCDNPRAHNFRYYGARGITICASWRESFSSFLRDVGRRPSPNHSIDRYPDNDGNYEPGNVRWATDAEQNANKRRRA
jgi:hypothetical protein